MTVAISVGPERAMSADSQSRADELKQQGNTAFKGDLRMGIAVGGTPDKRRPHGEPTAEHAAPAPCREALRAGAAVLHQGT